MKLSVIIANHNYGEFVGSAIESALAVDWPDTEVIVVDDASTDNSRSIIEGFISRAAAYFRPKSNQLGAHKFGFEQSTGDVIILLDSDDLLEPAVMQEVAKVWRSGVSKVQYRMNIIDAIGKQLGTAIPQFPTKDDPKKLRREYLRTMAYTTPPGSGNAYARDFVARAYAIPVPAEIQWSDSVLGPLAPILGDVLTIRKPLARYRSHGTDNTSVASARLHVRLQQDIERARLFMAISQRFDLVLPRDPLRANLQHLQNRLASYLAGPTAHPFPEDTKWSLVSRLIFSLAKSSSQMPLRDRAIVFVWTIACAVAPRHHRHNLIRWRFVATSRPAVIKTALHRLSSLRSPRLPNRLRFR